MANSADRMDLRCQFFRKEREECPRSYCAEGSQGTIYSGLSLQQTPRGLEELL